MIKVSLVGTGNVSQQLKVAMAESEGIEILQVLNSRDGSVRKSLYASSVNLPDIYIVAVNDDAIPIVSEQLNTTKKLVAHTSGSVSIDALPKAVRRGVFYPLQTLSKSAKINFKEVPLCIEADHKKDVTLLRKLAQCISDHVYEVSSKKRKHMHLAAVFVNNFTNHLYHIGAEICKSNDIPFSILHPLIAETARKITLMSPQEAQTGPAIRHDSKTMEEHLVLLKNSKHQEIYQLLSESIQDAYGKKL